MNIFGSIKALIWFFVMLIIVFIMNGFISNFVINSFSGITLIIVQILILAMYGFLVIVIPYLVATSD